MQESITPTPQSGPVPAGSVLNVVDWLYAHPKGAAVLLIGGLPIIWPVARALPSFVVVAWAVLALALVAQLAGRTDQLIAAFLGTAAFYVFLEVPASLLGSGANVSLMFFKSPLGQASAVVYWLLPGAILGLFVYRRPAADAVLSCLLLSCLPLFHSWESSEFSVGYWLRTTAPVMMWMSSVLYLGSVFGRIVYVSVFPKPVPFASTNGKTVATVAMAIVVAVVLRAYTPFAAPMR